MTRYSRRKILQAAALAPMMQFPKCWPPAFELDYDQANMRYRAYERMIYPPLPLDHALALIAEHGKPALSARALKILLAAYVAGGPEPDHTDYAMRRAFNFSVDAVMRDSKIVIAADNVVQLRGV